MATTAPQKAKKTKKQRKHGRANRNQQNARYKAERRHEKSHVRRIAKHLKRFPNDHYATQMLAQYKLKAGVG
jgi:hypothetical protein